MTAQDQPSRQPLSPRPDRSLWREPAFLALAALTAAIYFSRIDGLPIFGEEARWARGAAQMLETGDWIVLRQQGHVFPERPPMTSWSMALAALIWGDLDPVAIRLPSVVAVWLTSLLIYVYARGFLSSTGALVGGLAYATFGQVLQIGRHGESEALFTLFLGGALLVWHLGYLRGWTKAATWTTAYALAALGALCKGPQGPVYFVAVVCVFLVLRRDWQWLFHWTHAAGLAVFAGLIGAWQVPYYLMTDWTAVHDTWAGLAKDRFTGSGLIQHLFSYPFEILGCLLPWSPLLLLYLSRTFRQSLGPLQQPVCFLAGALAVTFPTVWFASIARGRYYMPLYPCLAVLIAIAVHQCATAPAGAFLHRAWKRFLLLGSLTSISLAAAAVGFLCVPHQVEILDDLSPAMLIAVAALGMVTASLQLWATQEARLPRTAIASLAFAGFLGLVHTGPVVSVYAASWHNYGPDVAQMKAQIPEPEAMVSLGPVNAGFAYHYRSFITELPWPTADDEVPRDLDYFFIMQYAADTPATHRIGRGRTWQEVPARLPFDWEEVARLPLARRPTEHSEQTLVLARVKRPAVAQRGSPQAVAASPSTSR